MEPVVVSGDRDEDGTRPPAGTREGSPVFAGVAEVCETAVRWCGVDGAAAAMFTKELGVRELVYATDPVAHRIDDLQFTLGEGPCLDAYLLSTPQLVDDVTATDAGAHWPAFMAEVADAGVAAVFAFPVEDDGRPLGVLELYRTTAGPLSEAEIARATACADSAARTIADNWSRYLDESDSSSPADAMAEEMSATDQSGEFSRSRVYTASGMLAVQLVVLPDEALDRMRAYAFRSGRPIGRVADDIIARKLTGADLDDPDRGAHDHENNGGAR
ncbi:GAF and ANTAR domain-containing protein [Gordonia sp. GN26]